MFLNNLAIKKTKLHIGRQRKKNEKERKKSVGTFCHSAPEIMRMRMMKPTRKIHMRLPAVRSHDRVSFIKRICQ